MIRIQHLTLRQSLRYGENKTHANSNDLIVITICVGLYLKRYRVSSKGGIRCTVGSFLFSQFKLLETHAKYMVYNFYFWISILICFIGFFVLRFGNLKRKESIEFIGGTITFISFVLVFVFVGWKALLIQILVFWFVITPINEIFIRKIIK